MRTILLRVAAILSAWMPLLSRGAAVPIVFEIPADHNPTNVFVQFLTSSTTLSAMYRNPSGNATSIHKNTAYSLASLTSPIPVGGGAPSNKPAILVSNFISGRIYFNYGTNGLAGLSDLYIPGAQNPADPNYYTRYGYLEPTVEGAKVTVNLTYIDFIGFSLSLEAVNAPHAANSPQLSANGAALAHATVNACLVPSNNVLPSAADMLPGTNFARVIAPQLRGDLYIGWTNYLKHFLQGKTNTLKGLFAGVGNQPSGAPLTQMQTYDFKVTFNTNGDALLVAQPGSGDGYTKVSPAKQGPGVGDTSQTVSITFEMLNSINGIYGNNPAYTIVNNGATTTTVSIQNDYFGWVVGDLMAGLSFGFLSSTVDFKGKAIGELYSAEWWGGMIGDGEKIDLTNSPAGHQLYFAKAQPDQPFNYHGYAGSIEPLTAGYGFALQDRPGKNLLELNTSTDTNGYLLIRLNPDEDPEPTLSIHRASGNVVLQWPSGEPAFQLHSESAITGATWGAVGIPPVPVGDSMVVTSPAGSAVQFFRLER